MKPFDLKLALAGDPVVTRNGRKVTELFYFKTVKGVYPITVVIDGIRHPVTIEGEYNGPQCASGRDLFMAPKITTYYAGVYSRNGFILVSPPCESEEYIKTTDSPYGEYIKTITFEVEE